MSEYVLLCALSLGQPGSPGYNGTDGEPGLPGSKGDPGMYVSTYTVHTYVQMCTVSRTLTHHLLSGVYAGMQVLLPMWIWLKWIERSV